MSDRTARPKKAVNVSLDVELLAEAKAFGTNLSQVLDQAVREAHREKKWSKWRVENREATTSMNDFVKKNGLWNKKYRVW